MLITNWAIAFTMVVFISGGILGYGAFLSHRTKAVSSFALGLGLITALSLLTGMAGLYRALPQGLLVAGGWVLLFKYRRALFSPLKGTKLTRVDAVALILPGLYLAARFFSDGLPQQHSDPLYYHLLAPKFWASIGQVRLTNTHPSYAQATLWELVYGWPQLWLGIFGTSNASSNVTAQIAGQWLHLIWGQLGSIVLGAIILVRRIKTPVRLGVGPALFVAWLCVSTPALEWTGTLAKNDYVFCLFLLAALAETFEKRFGLAGALVGLAFATKYFAFWTALALLILVPVSAWPRFIAGGLIGCLPLLLRNLAFTGNPFFPVLDNVIGPHWISDNWNAANAGFAGAPSLRGLIEMTPVTLARLFPKKLPLLLLGLGALGLVVRSVKFKRLLLKRELLFIVAQFTIAMLILKPAADARYVAPILIALLLILLPLFFEAFPRLTKRPVYLVPALVLGLLINIPVDLFVKVPRQYLFREPASYVALFHPHYALHDWVNTSLRKDEKIHFYDEKLNYYLDRDFEASSEMRKWEKIYAEALSAETLLTAVRKQGYDYFHFYLNYGTGPALSELKRHLHDYAHATAYKEHDSVVIDLRKLR